MSAFEQIEKLPIRPAFGTLRAVMNGVVLNANRPPTGEWLTAQPPVELAHVHRPARLSDIWEKVLNLLRNPVEHHQLADGVDVFNIIGSAVLVRSPLGVMTPYMWCQERLDQPYLEALNPARVILQSMPWRWIWLDKILGFVRQEYWAEIEFLNIGATPESLAEYFNWVTQLFRRRISQHADMAQVRRRIAHALELNPAALRRAHCGVPRGLLMSLATVQDYNDALLLHSELDQLEQDAPHLLPLYMALGNSSEFPGQGEPVQRLKTFLLANGFKESHWRHISKCNRRLTQPMRYVYSGQDVCASTLDYLRILCALGLPEQLPEPLAKTLFGVWGHPADRAMRYATEYGVHRCYPHIMKLAVARFGTVDFDVLQGELLAIIRWAWDVRLKLTVEQRREGWFWLCKQALTHREKLDAKVQGLNMTWQVPADTHAVGNYELRFLASAYDLWEEAKTMHHCVDTYVRTCQTSTARIASVSNNQRRVATAMFSWSGDKLELAQITGTSNRPVSMALTKALEVLHVDGANDRFESLPQDVRSGLLADNRPFDIARIVEARVRPEVTTNLTVEKRDLHMTALLTHTGDFVREAQITPVAAIANTFQIEFRSRLLTAKNPKETQRNFSMSLDRDGLLALKRLIDESLN